MTTLRIATALNIVALASVSFASPAWCQSSASAGTLKVNVTDPQSRPIGGAIIRYRRVPKTVMVANTLANGHEVPAPGEAAAYGEAAADANGSLIVTGLPAGRYALCAHVPSAAYLDPCVWRQPIAVAIPANVTAPRVVVLSLGVFLKVRVNDPGGLLPQVVDGLWTPRKLTVGVVYARGAYQAARNESVDAAGHDYQLIIPVGVPFTLRLFSHDVALTDLSGAALDMSGSKIAFQATPGQNQAFAFRVSGAAAR